jgi:hypothetical protein
MERGPIGSPGGLRPPTPTPPDMGVPDGSGFLAVPKDNAAPCLCPAGSGSGSAL